MRSFRYLKAFAVTVATCGLMLPADVLAGEPSQASKTQDRKSPAIVDIAISPDGTVSGQVVDPQGRGQTGTTVSVRQGGREAARVLTDERGVFAIDHVRPGVYQVVAKEGYGLFRFWAPRTAPPAAKKKVLIVPGHVIVRGQGDALEGAYGTGTGLVRISDQQEESYDTVAPIYPYETYGPVAGPGLWSGLDIITVATVATGVAAITVSAVAINRVNDVENKVDNLPKSP